MSRPTIRARAAALAEKTTDAYSFRRYRSWATVIEMLLRRGYSDAEAEAIVRSKWTRWAADASANRYGEHSALDLARFLDSKRNFKTKAALRAKVAGLVAGTL